MSKKHQLCFPWMDKHVGKPGALGCQRTEAECLYGHDANLSDEFRKSGGFDRMMDRRREGAPSSQSSQSFSQSNTSVPSGGNTELDEWRRQRDLQAMNAEKHEFEVQKQTIEMRKNLEMTAGMLKRFPDGKFTSTQLSDYTEEMMIRKRIEDEKSQRGRLMKSPSIEMGESFSKFDFFSGNAGSGREFDDRKESREDELKRTFFGQDESPQKKFSRHEVDFLLKEQQKRAGKKVEPVKFFRTRNLRISICRSWTIQMMRESWRPKRSVWGC